MRENAIFQRKNYMRRLSFGGVFRESARIFRLHFKKIIIMILLVMVPAGIVTAVSELFLLKNESVNLFLEVFSNNKSTQDEIYEAFYNAASSLVPFLLLMLVVAILSMLLPAAIARLTLDEGRRGILARYETDEAMNVVHSDDFDHVEVLSGTTYVMNAIKMLPRIAICAIIGTLIASLGFLIMFIPGMIIAVVAGLSCYFVSLTGLTFFKGLLGTGGALLKRPLMMIVYLISGAATLMTTFLFGFAFSFIPLNGTAGIAGSVAITTVTLCLSSVVSAFGSIAVSCYMINALDISGYERTESGFMEKIIRQRENPFQQ